MAAGGGGGSPWSRLIPSSICVAIHLFIVVLCFLTCSSSWFFSQPGIWVTML